MTSTIPPIIIKTDDGTEAMRVDPSGKVGIGTTSPNNQLVVAAQASFGGNTGNTGTEPIEVQGSGAGVSFYDRTGESTGRWVIYSDRTGGAGTETLRFWSAGDKVTITQGGNVGIGTSTPSATLNVDPQGPGGIVIGNPNTGQGGFTSLLLDISAASGGYAQLQAIKSSGTEWGDIEINPNGGNVSIAANGTASASKVTANTVTANGEVVVNNAPGTPTIVLDGNSAMIEVGAPGADGGITVYNKSHSAVCTINGQNGKTSVTVLKASAGVTAQATGNGWALGGFASHGAYAGYFGGGEVYIDGGLDVTGAIRKGGGGFKIDHPLDPANKYLAHSYVESPDMKNIYDGVVMLDANGEAIVELPEWFAALNRDVRYQLTCIGDYAPVYIARKMQDNRFKIAGGKPEMEVSWQVTGIRQDAWACAHRLCTEEEKPPAEQGYYLHPEENGADVAMSIQQIRRSQSV